ncbi:MAG: hypothetical protein L6Q98_12570 [Anaerolineae bacterium]|nr:hypothetical protein [Anaerolineae bacterium]NUQ04606.1 hypothetical protein [Anaerolineae bacterium]
MGIELYWDNDDRSVMLVEVRGAFTWDEMYETLGKIKKVTERSPVEIGAILDMGADVRFPGGSVFNAAGLQHARNMLAMSKDGTGPMVVVGVSGIIRKVYDWFTAMDARAFANVKFADTLPQAQHIMAGRGFTYAPRAAAGD